MVSDANRGMAAARQAVFPTVPWQRFQFHLLQNAQAYVPRLEMRIEVAESIRSIFAWPDLTSAQARLKERVSCHAKSAPKFAAWMEHNLPQGFVVYALPVAHHRRMRTSNAIEQVNQELKRRTRIAALVPNKASLPRLFCALHCEQCNGKIYLNMNPAEPSQS